MTTSRDSLDSILEDYKGGVKSAWNNNYGENVWNAEEQADREAKQALHQWALDREKEARVAELERLMKWSNGYPPDRSYSRGHFYVVERQDLADRIQELLKGDIDES